MTDFGHIKPKTSFLIPSATMYARHALATLGMSDRTTGYWPHTLQVCLLAVVCAKVAGRAHAFPLLLVIWGQLEGPVEGKIWEKFGEIKKKIRRERRKSIKEKNLLLLTMRKRQNLPPSKWDSYGLLKCKNPGASRGPLTPSMRGFTASPWQNRLHQHLALAIKLHLGNCKTWTPLTCNVLRMPLFVGFLVSCFHLGFRASWSFGRYQWNSSLLRLIMIKLSY